MSGGPTHESLDLARRDADDVRLRLTELVDRSRLSELIPSDLSSRQLMDLCVVVERLRAAVQEIRRQSERAVS